MAVIGTFTKALKDTIGKIKETTSPGGGTNAAKGTSGGGSSGKNTSTPSGGYTKYTGGNAALDNSLKQYQDAYSSSRVNGDWQGMNTANEKANQLRNQYGYAAQSAYDDINRIRSQNGGGTDFSQGGITNTARQGTQIAPGVNDYSQYIEEMNQAAKESALSELRSAYQKNLAGLDRTEQSISPTYTAARNQAAGSAELAKRQFNEYAAANGLNSGAGGQAQLAMNNALQTNLSNLNTQEASSLADLDLQRSQTETDYNNAIAKAESDGNYTLAQQLYTEKVRADEALRSQMQWQAEQDYNNSYFQWQQNQADVSNQKDDTSNLYQMIMQYAKSTGDYSLLGQFGFTSDQIAKWQAQWQADNVTPISSRSTSASGGSGKSAGTGSTASGYNAKNTVYDFAPVTIQNLPLTAGTKPTIQKLTSSIGGTMSTSGQRLLSQLRSIPGLTEDNKTAMVQDAYQNGRISENDVNKILAAIGY